MELKFKKLDPAAVTPSYGTTGAACFDLTALDNGTPHPGDSQALIYRTGLSFQIPAGWAMEIHSRSGHGFKNALRLSNCCGVIDADYRGEVMVAIRGDGQQAVTFKAGDRIAQAKLVEAPQVQFSEVAELDSTARGAGGFGSTGTSARA